MKNLKFRAYNNATDKMTDWEFIRKVKNLNKLMTLNHVDVMQYTGFKDINGKEIYEGDILGDSGDYKKVYWDDITGCWYLDFEYEGKRDIGNPMHIEINSICRNFEVSGNIYHNPELLKPKQ